MQAIQTRYLGPTNRNGARILAECEAKRIIRSVASLTNGEGMGMSPEKAHIACATELAREMGWLDRYELVTGVTRAGAYVHCLRPLSITTR